MKKPRKNTFRLKSKPRRPKRNMKMEYSNTIYGSESVQDILYTLEEYGVEPKDAFVTVEHSYYDEHDVCLKFHYQEPEEQYQERLAHYKQRLEKWEAWYAANKEEIEAELARREAEEQKRLAKVEEKARVYKLRAIARLEKELTRMKRRMGTE